MNDDHEDSINVSISKDPNNAARVPSPILPVPSVTRPEFEAWKADLMKKIRAIVEGYGRRN